MKFRKVYLIVEENKIFGEHNYQMVNMFRDRRYADNVCASQNKRAKDEATLLCNQNKPIPTYKVHGFWLLHENLLKD